MKILLWAPFGSGLHYWGPGTSAFNLYREGLPEDITIDLVHGFSDQPTYPVFDNQHYISELDQPTYLNTAKFLWHSKDWIYNNLDQYDIMHALSSFHYSFLPAYWSQKCGRPSFVKITAARCGFSNTSVSSKMLGLGKWRKKHVNDVEGYIAISKEIAAELESFGIPNEKIHQIPNGVNTNRFHPISDVAKKALRSELGIEDMNTLLFVGGISERKNPSLIVESLGMLERNDLQLVLVGPSREKDGLEMRRIDEAIRKYDLQDRVIVVDFTSDIHLYYQASDVFVLPSRNEGLSNALLEALSSGLPSIVTRISGSEDVVKEGLNGFFVEQTADSLCEKINVILNSEEKLNLMSRAARGDMVEEYDSRIILKRHLALFSGAL